MRACVLLFAMGCSHQIAPVAPWDALTYRFVDVMSVDGKAVSYGRHLVSDEAEVLVGQPLEAEGFYAATCKRTTEPFGEHPDSAKYPDKIGPCKRQPTDVSLRCVGACNIGDRVVTPTAPGKLTVQVTLTSRETRQTTQIDHDLVAVEAEDFEIRCAEGFLASETDKVCVPGTEPIMVSIRGGKKGFNAAFTANGVTVEPGRYGTELPIARVIGSAPTDFRTPAPGEYEVELVFGSLRRTVSFEVR